MAIAYDNFTGLGTTTGTSLTANHTNTGSDLITFVGVTGSASSDRISGVTIATVAMDLVKKYFERGRWRYLFAKMGPAAGVNSIVVTSSSSDFIRANAVSYTGVNQTTNPEASETSSQAANINEAVSINTITDNAWVVLFAFAHSVTAGAGTTRRGQSTGDAILDSNGPISPAGSTTLNAVDDEGTDPWANIIVSLKPAGAAAAAVTRSPSGGAAYGCPMMY